MYRVRSASKFLSKINYVTGVDCIFASRSIAIASSVEIFPNAPFVPLSFPFHSFSRTLNASFALDSIENEEIVFPRETGGLNYKLNWSLAKIGITPKNEAYKNLSCEDLKNYGAKIPGSKSKYTLYTKGEVSNASNAISSKHFSKLLKEVKSHISGSEKVFAQDLALGSAPQFDSKIRVVCDSPDPDLTFLSFLSKASPRKIASENNVCNVYVATSYQNEELGKDGFVALDLDTSQMIVTGKAFADLEVIKSALISLSYSNIFSKGALFLPGDYLRKENASIVVIASKSVFSAARISENASTSNNFGSILSNFGVAQVFKNPKFNSPNLFRLPSSVVILISDSSHTVPTVTKINASQAAYYYLCGFDGADFNSFYSSFPLKTGLLSSSLKLYEILNANSISAYIVNVHEEKDVENLIFSIANDRIPKSKTKKPSEASLQALKEKFENFVKEKYPELPTEISP